MSSFILHFDETTVNAYISHAQEVFFTTQLNENIPEGLNLPSQVLGQMSGDVRPLSEYKVVAEKDIILKRQKIIFAIGIVALALILIY